VAVKPEPRKEDAKKVEPKRPEAKEDVKALKPIKPLEPAKVVAPKTDEVQESQLGSEIGSEEKAEVGEAEAESEIASVHEEPKILGTESKLDEGKTAAEGGTLIEEANSIVDESVVNVEAKEESPVRVQVDEEPIVSVQAKEDSGVSVQAKEESEAKDSADTKDVKAANPVELKAASVRAAKALRLLEHRVANLPSISSPPRRQLEISVKKLFSVAALKPEKSDKKEKKVWRQFWSFLFVFLE
jgi:hypothetical protein